FWRRKWLAHFREKVGPDSLEYAGELEVEASNSLREKNWAGAEPILRECLALREKSGTDAWPKFQAISMLGNSLLGQKKSADAEPLLLAGYEGLKRLESSIPKSEANRVPEAIDRLILLYTVTEKPPEVDRWRAERAKYPPAKQPKTAHQP
ncbi:MAG: hypothetical protein K1X57_21745, partial [Gemmataceae bacterium]|nr:hypothetical protein [Gemmataceae bacterium]